ncbi:MAG: serine/threonine-protein kinase [Verrucomicrobiota bacterium]
MSSSSGYSASRPGEFDAPTPEELDKDLPNYKVEKMIAKGGMGAVYEATQDGLGRKVAVKLLPNIDDDGGMQMVERFKREANSMAKLNHRNIIEVHDIGRTASGMHYFAMEHVDGHDLHTLLHTGKLTTDHVHSWIPQVCDALQHAHAAGLIHRDIKPANVLVNSEGVVKMCDFGLARPNDPKELVARLTMTNVALGTPDYAAPEARVAGVDADSRADLYAIGVILYQMLTGRLPRGAWRPPSAIVPGMDPRFDPIVIKALAPEPADRYQHANEISLALREIRKSSQYKKEEDSAAEEESQKKRVKRRKGKKSDSKVMWIIVGVVAVAAIAGLIALIVASG